LASPDDDAVEQVGEPLPRIARLAPGVGDEAGGDARPARREHGRDHPGLDPRVPHQAPDQAGRGDVQEFGEALLELALGHRPGLQAGQQAAGGQVGAEQVGDGVGGQALAGAEGGERGEDVAGHHPAPVDQQAGAPALLVRHAKTPSAKRSLSISGVPAARQASGPSRGEKSTIVL
jgi:hypothetical protein